MVKGKMVLGNSFQSTKTAVVEAVDATEISLGCRPGLWATSLS